MIRRKKNHMSRINIPHWRGEETRAVFCFLVDTVVFRISSPVRSQPIELGRQGIVNRFLKTM